MCESITGEIAQEFHLLFSNLFFFLSLKPAQMYHRFGLGEGSSFIHAMRLFSDQPKWEAIPRHKQ